MENGEKIKKYKRKIKIRLLDSSNPNSYICELFDSSLENEDSSFGDPKEVLAQECNTSNLKSYFEILMSKECRRTLKRDCTKENNEISRKSKAIDTHIKEISNQKGRSKKNNSDLPIKLVIDKKLGNCETDSSEDESLFQVQQKCKLKKTLEASSFEICKETKDLVEESEIQIVYASKNKCTSPEYISQKKNINILNYFTRNEASFKTQLEKVEELEEIIRGERTFKSTKCKDKLKIDNSLRESNQNEQEKPVGCIKKQNVKIAPLFQIKERKALDIAAKKARYNFLHKESVFPKSSNNNTIVDLILDFRPTCHVQQRDDNIYWTLRKISSPLPELSSARTCNANHKFRTYVTCSKLNNFSNSEELNQCTQIELNNKKLGEIKLKYKDLNLDIVIDGLKKKRDKFAKLNRELRSSKSGNKRIDESSLELLNSQWIEKYKPSSSEMLGNEKVVKKLKNWLQSWKHFDEELKRLAKSSKTVKQVDSDYDSEDDYFVKSGNDNYGLKPPGSVCLLSGPCGCGKTALVSSLAEELEFNVIEVNASSKRTGKKVLAEFQEATQSHKVQHLSLPQMLKPQPVKKAKSKKQKSKTKPSAEEMNDRKISLLLIEDADIVFDEHDDGFYSAITSLVQTSKRPFVFVTDNFDCEQLDSFKTDDSLMLKMEYPSFKNSCAFLDILSQVEGVPIDRETAEFLVLQNKFDLRKSILELQFWNGPRIKTLKSREPFDSGRLWWGLAKFLYPGHVESSHKPVQFKRKRQEDPIWTCDGVENVTKKAKISPEGGQHLIVPVSDRSGVEPLDSIRPLWEVLDVACVIDLLGSSSGDEPIPGTDYKPKSSLSLEEKREVTFAAEKTFGEEICRDLVIWAEKHFNKRTCCEHTSEEKISFSYPSWDDIRWRNLQEETREQLCTLVPSTHGRDRKGVHLDYLPIVRCICRLERNRSVTNSKRKNRFCHYFNGNDLELTDKTLDITCQVFSR